MCERAPGVSVRDSCPDLAQLDAMEITIRIMQYVPASPNLWFSFPGALSSPSWGQFWGAMEARLELFNGPVLWAA